MVGGLYQILNTVTGERYVGRTNYFARRFKLHAQRLRDNKHDNRKLQFAYNKYGAQAFRYDILIETPDEEVRRTIEQLWLDHGTGEYNLSRSATTAFRPGDRHTPETRAKISATKRERCPVFSQEARVKMSAWQLGRKLTPEHRANIAAGQRGSRQSQETCAKIRAAHLGKPKSAAHRQALREAALRRHAKVADGPN